MADWNGFKKNGTTYIPNDATARAGVIANTKLIKDTVGWSGKNKNYHNAQTSSQGTVTYTVNANKTIELSGVATSSSIKDLRTYTGAELKALGSKLVLSGGNAKAYLAIRTLNYTFIARSFGDAVEFDTSTLEDATTYYETIGVAVSSGSSVDLTGVVIYPMIRDADILDDTYEPYFGSTAFPRSEQAVLGARNFMAMPYRYSIGYSWTVDNITYGIQSDGSITVVSSGGNAGRGEINIHGRLTGAEYAPMYLPKGHYKASTGSSDSQMKMYFGVTYNGAYREFVAPFGGDTEVEFTIDDNTLSDYKLADGSVLVAVYFVNNQSNRVINTTIKPMIKLATDPNTAFSPFAMTNKQLTDVVNGITVKSFTTEQFTVNAGQYSPQEISIANGDLIPLGIVGYRIDGNGNTECGMWKNWMDISTKKALFGIKNFSAGATATITVTIFVLYKG